MSQLLNEITIKVDSYPKDFIKKLIENDSLIHFIKNLITNHLCDQIFLEKEFDYEKSNRTFCKKNNLKDTDQLLKYLSIKGMRLEDHKRNLINSNKILFYAKREFADKAKSDFIKNKNLLDLYTYDFIELFESDIAHEIYFQLEANESTFKKLTFDYSQEKSLIKSFGTKGPVDLGKLNPIIRKKLLTINDNDVIPPFKLDNFWLLIVLKDKTEAIFDEFTQSKMVIKLFDEWINLLTIKSIQKLIT